MDRSLFSQWGASLPEAEFAQALLGFSQPVESSTSPNPARPQPLVSWQLEELPSSSDAAAEEMRDQGRNLLQQHPRIEIGNVLPEVGWLAAWLELSKLVLEAAPSYADDPCGSVYCRVESHLEDLNWRWPLRVGLLPDAVGSAFARAWQKDLEDHGPGNWVERLFPRVRLGYEHPECDVLVIPTGVKDACQQLQEFPERIFADLVLIMDPSGELPQDIATMQKILPLAHCSAVAVFPVSPDERLWGGFPAFRHMARCLTHGHAIDQALYRATSTRNAPPPLLLSSRALMLASSLHQRAGNLVEKLKEASSGPPKTTRTKPKTREHERSAPRPRPRGTTRGPRKIVRTPFMEDVPARGVDLASRKPTLHFPLEGRAASTFGLPQGPITFGTRRLPGSEGGMHPMEMGSVEIGTVATELENYVERDDSFLRELDGATVIAEVEAAASDAGLNTSQSRFLQAAVFTGDAPPEESEAESTALKRFLAGQIHGVQVHIGPLTRSKKHLHLPGKFPDEELPQDLDEYRLTVDFVPLTSKEAPQRSTLILPRQGKSEPCQFAFTVPADAEQYEARILVSYRNRVLQTGRLRGPTSAAKRSGGKREKSIVLLPECMARQKYSALQGPAAFAASFVFNETADDRPLITRLTDRGVSLGAADGVEALVTVFDKYFSEVALEAEQYAEMSERTVDFLRDIVMSGHSMYLLLKGLDGDGVFGKSGAIQVFTKRDGIRIPLEFVYQSEEMPGETARLCPDWKVCLQERKCRHQDSRDEFCPARFWGLSRIIERHSYDPRLRPKLSDDYRLQAEPVENRKKLPLLKSVLLAASSRVDDSLGSEKGMSTVELVAKQVAGKSTTVTLWEDWRTKVLEKPDCLLLILHTEPRSKTDKNPDQRRLEIGGDLSLLSGQVNAREVGGGNGHYPLVLLLGCHTGSAAIPFETLTSRFKAGQAAVVVGSGSYIHSLHAVPFMRLFLQQLREALDEPEPVSFGEFMRRLRVRCVLEGHLMILALTAYGDADWILSKAQ